MYKCIIGIVLLDTMVGQLDCYIFCDHGFVKEKTKQIKLLVDFLERFLSSLCEGQVFIQEKCLIGKVSKLGRTRSKMMTRTPPPQMYH